MIEHLIRSDGLRVVNQHANTVNFDHVPLSGVT